MSSTSVTPVSATAVSIPSKQTEFAKIFAFLGAHLLLTALVVLGVVYGIEKVVAAHDATAAAKYAVIFSTQQTALTQELSQNAENEKEWQAQIASILTQNGVLAKGIVSRDTQSSKQVAVDATLSTTDVAARLTSQIDAGSGEILPTATGVSVDLPAARSIVTDLDLLVTTRSDYADTRAQLAGETTIATDAQTDVVDQKKIAVGLQAQLQTQVTACNTQVAALKSASRKNKFKVFFEGVGVGIGIAVGIAIHGV